MYGGYIVEFLKFVIDYITPNFLNRHAFVQKYDS